MPYLPENAPLFLADHPVIDFLNTVCSPAGELVDALQSDADVLYWLEQAGLSPAEKPSFAQGALLQQAHRLRDIIRPLVQRRKEGKRIDATALNQFLAQAPSYAQLVTRAGQLHVEHHRSLRTPQQVLAPIAEAAAEFLTTADFDLVRPCEGHDCVLWFYDRTKSHRRRWCSMQVCGNRHKVEAFRERQRA